jgi:hypothetical protein
MGIGPGVVTTVGGRNVYHKLVLTDLDGKPRRKLRLTPNNNAHERSLLRVKGRNPHILRFHDQGVS